MPEGNMGIGFCERIDLNFSLALPADAPRGHLHLLNTKRYKSNQADLPVHLSLVDVLTTLIFEWNPAALHYLLNVANEEFYCEADWEEDSLKYNTPKKRVKFVYIHRSGKYVRVAIVGTHLDSEVSYRICDDGQWEIKSAQLRQSSANKSYCITAFLEDLDNCDHIEEDMPRDMAERFLVEGVLEDMSFPVWNYISKSRVRRRSQIDSV